MLKMVYLKGVGVDVGVMWGQWVDRRAVPPQIRLVDRPRCDAVKSEPLSKNSPDKKRGTMR